MSHHLAKKARIKHEREARQLSIQVKRVQSLENSMIGLDPVQCPVQHHFADGVYCRELHFPAGLVLTGVIYKIETFIFLVKGRLRVVEGDHTRDIEAPAMLKNRAGTKNAWYAYEDCLLYSVTPNPTNSRDLHEVMSVYSETDPAEVQGMGKNKQELNYQKRLSAQTQGNHNAETTI